MLSEMEGGSSGLAAAGASPNGKADSSSFAAASAGGQLFSTLKRGAGKKFTSQQHLFRQMDRKYKRLVGEMELAQQKHRTELKEVRF